MLDQFEARTGFKPIHSIQVKVPVCNIYRQHVASTPEGCQISRDEEFGFVVACGEESKGQRHVPTLSAAYAICQQLMPRKPTPGS